MFIFEPNQLGSSEDSSKDPRSSPREVESSNNKGDNRNHFDVSDETCDDSDFMHTRPSSTDTDEFNASQNIQENKELIIGKRIQKLETSKTQGRPTETARSDQQKVLININDQAILTE